MKVYFYTLGCKVNQYETQSLCELLCKKGFERTPEPNDADICIINSCTVTAESDRKTRQHLRKIRGISPNAVTVLMGCMPQAYPETANALTQADIVLGNTDISAIPDFIEKFLQTGERIVSVSQHAKKERFSTPIISSFEERTRAYIKIEDGCDRYCSYCIIPKARGDIRSKSISDIEAEAEALGEKGYKEVVLVGINLTSFGKDTGKNIADAVEAVAKQEKIMRIRLGSIEPDLIDEQTLLRLNCVNKFCPQFHLALQSGSDSVLKRMNRHYDTAFFYELVCRIRKIFENPSVTTDIMVGFSGETEAEHKQSLDFVKKVGFAKCHIFAYSKRKGTVAAEIKDNLTNSEKEKRSKEMLSVANASSYNFLDTQIGLSDSILPETYEDGYAYGFTKNYCRVKVETKCFNHGEIMNIKIIGREKDVLLGKPTSNP